MYTDHPDLLETYSWRSERRKLYTEYKALLGDDEVATDIEDETLADLITLESG